VVSQDPIPPPTIFLEGRTGLVSFLPLGQQPLYVLSMQINSPSRNLGSFFSFISTFSRRSWEHVSPDLFGGFGVVKSTGFRLTFFLPFRSPSDPFGRDRLVRFFWFLFFGEIAGAHQNFRRGSHKMEVHLWFASFLFFSQGVPNL